jgi:two-component system, sensor histidine kinase LadS
MAFFPLSGIDAQPIELTDSTEKYTLRIIEVLEDQAKSLNFQDALKSSSFYVPGKELRTPYGEYIYKYKNDASYWIRFTVLDQSSVNKYWLLQYMDPNIDKISVYIPDVNGIYKEYESGSVFSFFHRPVLHKNFEFHIPFSKGKPSVIYLKIDPGSSRVFVAELNTYENFIAHSLEEYLLLGLFYGFIIMMGTYNFVLYISIGERHYLYYVFYTICVCLFFMHQDGLGFQFIWPNNPSWQDKVLTYSLFGMIVWTIFYSKWFLDYKNRMPLVNTILIIILIITSGILLTAFIFPKANEYFLIPVACASYLLIYISAFRIFLNGYKPAGYFLLGYTFLFFGFIIRLLTYFNYFLETMFTVYSYNAGILIEMMLFSIAIGYKIKTIKQEREAALIEKNLAHQEIIDQLKVNEDLKNKVNRELELKVSERTMELSGAKDELEKAYEEIKRMNDLLKEDNEKLEYDIKELARASVMLKGVNFEEFCRIYPTDEACLKFLAAMKWRTGFQCAKCGNTKWFEGKTPHSRSCTKCKYDESPVLHTIFSRVKFPLTKAFYMLFLYVSSKEKLTSTHLSKILKLRQKTCWSFLQKIKNTSEDKKSSGKSIDKWTDLILE